MNFTIEELLGAIVNFGCDPYLIEDEDAALDLLLSIERSSSVRIITDLDEFDIARRQLALDDCQVKSIYSFVDGSEFLVCFSADWD